MSAVITLPAAPRELVFCVDEFPVLTGSIVLPERSRSGGRFNRYYRSCADIFERCCRRELLPRAQSAYYRALENAALLPQWEARLVTALTLQQGAVLSLHRDTTVQGLSHPCMARQGDTWDLRRELLLRPEDCFPSRTPWRRLLLQHAAAEVESRERLGTLCPHPGWRQALPRAFRARDFYLTEEGFCFFFPPGTIAPAAAGCPTFCLPYDQDAGPFLPNV